MSDEAIVDAAAYRITFNADTNRLEIALAGHLSEDGLENHRRDVVAAMRALRHRGVRDLAVLLDLSRSAVQSQSLLQRFMEMATRPELAHRRAAVILPVNMLAKLQARRIMAGMPMFADRAAAIASLDMP